MPLNTKTITMQLAAAAATGIAAAQSVTAATPMTLSGSLVTGGVATMDVARRVLLTFAADETGHNFVLTGTDRYGRPQIETVAGAAATAQSTKDFLTITKIVPSNNGAGNVSAGTNGVGSSDAYICDWVPNGNLIGAQLIFNGTANVTVQESMDDLSPAWDQANNTVNWFDDTNLASKSSNAHGQLAGPFTMIRLTVNSGTTAVTLKLITPFIGGRI